MTVMIIFNYNFMFTAAKFTIVSFKFCIFYASVKYNIKTKYIMNYNYFFTYFSCVSEVLF